MAQVPPSRPEGQDDKRYVDYYRSGNTVLGSPEKLKALADGYFGLNYVFLLNVVLAFGSRGVISIVDDPGAALLVIAIVLAVMFATITLATLPSNRKIGFGKNWPDSTPVLASLLMGLNSALCCGIIGYIVMQNIALNEMKKYGVRAGSFFGLKRRDVEARIADMRATQQPPGFQP